MLFLRAMFSWAINLNIVASATKTFSFRIQVNLCQKLLFLHQLTHNMTTDCSLNYKFNTSSNLGRACCVQKLFLKFRKIFVHNMLTPCSAKRRASDKDLPVFWSTFEARNHKKLELYIWQTQIISTGAKVLFYLGHF